MKDIGVQSVELFQYNVALVQLSTWFPNLRPSSNTWADYSISDSVFFSFTVLKFDLCSSCFGNSIYSISTASINDKNKYVCTKAYSGMLVVFRETFL